MNNKFVLFATVSLLVAPKVFAWGNRGHHEICAAATYLVKDPALKEFLRSKEHRMGLLCNIPDIYWRDLPPEVTKLGNPTHFLNPENAGSSLKTLSSNYQKVKKQVNNKDVLEKMGTLWWRADQFYKRAVFSGKKATQAKPPQNIIENQKRDLDFNRNVFQMHVDMGILGHFAGDVTMPYHTTADYDGWKNGHGGIHAFYEDTCVDKIEATLKSEIIEAAKRLVGQSFLDSKKSVVERMREVSLLAANEVSQIEKLDVVLAPSQNELRTPAKRKIPSEACPAFKTLIVLQLARSSALLAQFWNEIYEKSQKPKLELYKSYEYPFKPDFVEPDYTKQNQEGFLRKFNIPEWQIEKSYLMGSSGHMA